MSIDTKRMRSDFERIINVLERAPTIDKTLRVPGLPHLPLSPHRAGVILDYS